MCVKIRLIGFTGVVVMSGWGGLGGYIDQLSEQRDRAADPGDTSPFANLTRRACDAVARTGLPPAAAPHAHYACGPYWEDAPYDPPSDPVPPFVGGQCSVPYRVRLEWEEGQNTGVQVFTNRLGPIGAPSVVFERDEGGGFEQYLATFSHKFNAGGSVIDVTTSHRFDTTGGGLSSFTVERMDGLADECGDPPAGDRDPVDLPPGLLPPNGSPVDISDPNDPSDTTPPVVFAPDPPPEYEPFVPFVPSFPGQPPFAFPPGPGDDIPPRVGDPVDVPSGGTGSEDVETPDDDLPDECIGYAWEFYDIPAHRGGIPGTEPSRFYEIFGSAQLRVSSRDGAVYDNPVKIDSARGVCYRSDRNLRVRGLSLNSKTSFGPVRVRPIYVVVREG